MNNLLSKRAEVSTKCEDFFLKNLSICDRNPYHETHNPTGIINFGTAVNNLCNDIIYPRLNDLWCYFPETLGYTEDDSTMRLRKAMADFMTVFLECDKQVCPDDLFFVTGVTSCIDVLGHCLSNPGDVFLVPTPMYNRIDANFMLRSLIKVFPVPIIIENDDDKYPTLTIEKIICAHEIALRKNHEVRGIFLINPNNPLGDIYSPELLMSIMSFCQANSLHLIVDEIYALSAFSETEKFHSILKFSRLPDPDRVHVLYGLSKDFGLAGLRIGVIHTKCKQLQESLMELTYFQRIPQPVTEIAAIFLEDLQWCRDYIFMYKRRLAENYKYCVDFLQSIGIKIRECKAGYFLWVDLRHLCGSSIEGERYLFNYLLNNARLYICRGEEFSCVEPGWFQIVFAQADGDLKKGLTRFREALDIYDKHQRKKKFVPIST